MIIALTGKKGSGKDYTAEKYIEDHPEFKIAKLAGPLKEICRKITGLPQDSQEDKKQIIPDLGITVRDFQIVIGMGYRAQFGDDYWVNLLLEDYDESCNWIVTDLRMENEYQILKSLGAKCYRIHNPDNPNNDSTEKTEVGLDHVELPIIWNKIGSEVGPVEQLKIYLNF